MVLFDDDDVDLPNNAPDIKELRDRVEELDDRIESVSVDRTELVCPICFNRLRTDGGEVVSCQGTGRRYPGLGLPDVCGCSPKIGFRFDLDSDELVRIERIG